MYNELILNLKRVINHTLTCRGLIEWCEEATTIDKLKGTLIFDLIEEIIDEWRTWASYTNNRNFEFNNKALESWLQDLSELKGNRS